MLSDLSPPGASQSENSAVAHAARVLASASRVLVFTGAGMSADSGLPTYRGIGGLYDQQATADGVDIEQALSGDMFARDPALTWKYICQIEAACRGARPHVGHIVLARWQRRFRHVCVITQNVDGLHQATGERDVIEMHGHVHRLCCTGCERTTDVTDFSDFGALPPTCYVCGSVLRPAVVLFGEMLPMRAVARYEMALAEGFDALVAIGTSAVFPYIVEPFREAHARGVPTIEINPRETAITHLCDARVRMSAAKALLAVDKAIGR